MFSKFLNFFDKHHIEYKIEGSPYETLLNNFEGMEFGEGIFRLFNKKDLYKWNEIVTEVYPEFKDNFDLFGYDWLGRCFAIDLRDRNTLMFEIEAGEVLNISCDILEFFNVEIPVYNDACLASTFYKEWVEYCGKKAKLNYCMGYKIPLFLGGEEDISNLEEIDMEVYWSITGQLNNQC